MGSSVKKLQIGLLIGAALLVAVVAGYLGYARYLLHHFKLNLPGKLGVDIVQETNGYTYSQSLEGKTIYTIHAAKAVQHSNGKWTLHDVGIVLYGRKQDRADHIYGNEFEYDQKAGEIRAAGEVRIDLAAAASAYHGQKEGGIRVSGPTVGEPDEHVIHVKTSGLLFEEKLHRAATDQQVDFTSGGLAGHAHGADYDSETGSIVLRSEVVFNGVVEDRPSVLKATHAEMNQQDHLILLRDPRYSAVSNGHGEETLAAASAIIHTDAENNPERIEADTEVTMTASGRGTLTADHADALIAKGRPQSAHLFGRLRYLDQEMQHQTTGEAQDARITFDALGRLAHMIVTGDVTGLETVPAGTRELHAVKVEMAFTALGKEPATLQDAQAAGNARLQMVETVVKAGAKQPLTTKSDLTGDVLTAHFERIGAKARLASVHGAGNTVVHRAELLNQGIDQTSTGDLLDVLFEPRPAAGPAHSADAVQLQRATQHGHVTLLRTSATGSKEQIDQHGTATDAVYDAAADRMILTGAAHLADPASALWAQRITVERGSGDATADGSVRASYLQAARPNSPPPEPVHILADRALFDHDAGTAIFYGKSARLWQGGTQVEAPVLDFDQTQRTLHAHGEGTGEAAVVHTVLAPQNPAPKQTGKPGHQGPARIASRELTYSDLTRQIDFTGSVRVDDADGILLTPKAVIYLSQSSTPKPQPATVAMPGGDIDHIVASGGVEMRQPGRIATGDQLIYTGADQIFVLTGTKSAPPKIVDETQGTITGDTMRFHSGDRSVVVQGGTGTEKVPARVHSETQVKE